MMMPGLRAVSDQPATGARRTRLFILGLHRRRVGEGHLFFDLCCIHTQEHRYVRKRQCGRLRLFPTYNVCSICLQIMQKYTAS